MDDTLIEKMGASPIRLYPDRCLNLRHHKADCNYCVSSCPSKALSIKDRTILRDESVCVGCGLCLSACPMEVFTSRAWSERHVLESVSESSEHAVELLCARHPEAVADSVRPGVLTLSVCLAALSPGVLFGAGLAKHVNLRVDACPDCPLAHSLVQIENAASLAGSWLSAVGREGYVSLSDAPVLRVDEQQMRKKRGREKAVSKADKAKYSRRDFLTGFARDGSSLFAAFLGIEPEDAAGQAIGDEAPHSPRRPHLHRWREALSKAYPRVPEASGAPALWPDLTVSDACTGCGVCDQFCPDEALRSRVRGSHLTRTFTPGLCADCALCALSCPDGAITRGYAECAQPFEPRVLLDVSVGRCSRCNAPTMSPETTLCHWCASEPSMDVMLDEVKRRLLFRESARGGR